jgi:hypothetical protein
MFERMKVQGKAKENPWVLQEDRKKQNEHQRTSEGVVHGDFLGDSKIWAQEMES